MIIYHIEANGRTNTGAYVDAVTRAVREVTDASVQVFTSCESRYPDEVALPVFDAYREAEGSARKLRHYVRGWQRILAHLAARPRAPMVLHYHWPKFSPVDLWAVRTVRQRFPAVRLVGTVHNVLPHEPLPFDRLLLKRLYAASHHLTFFGPSSVERFRSVFGEVPTSHSLVPHFSYAVPAALPEGNLRPRLLFFGAIRPYKGLDVLLEACAGLDASLPWSLTVAGKPEHVDVEALMAKARQGRVYDRIRWQTGWIDDAEVDRLFQEHDIVVLPYRRVDGSGLLHLAMSYGKLVIASAVGCLQDVVRHGENGLLCPPGDTKALGDLLQAVLKNPTDFVQLAHEAHRTMKGDHTLRRIGELHAHIYANLHKSGTTLAIT